MTDNVLVTVGLAVAVFAAGWFAGYRFEADRFADYRAKVMAEVRAAAAKQEEMVKRHEQTKQFIEQDYETRLADIESYYRELLDDNAGGDGVSPVPATPSGSHGTATCKPVPVVTKDCAKTALRLKELQDWIRGVSD